MVRQCWSRCKAAHDVEILQYWSRCKASQAHEESCVSNSLRMYAAEMVMDQGKTWLAQAGELIDW
jgi:hypothetical protein